MRVDVPKLLAALGVKARRQGRKLWAPCPAHEERTPSWSVVDDTSSQKHASHHCFGCSFGGGPWELAAQVLGLSLDEAAAWVRSNGFGAPTADVPKVVLHRGDSGRFELPAFVQVPSLDGSMWFRPALDYLRARGVEDWQIERWHIGFATRGRCAMRVVVPVVTGGRLVSYVARAFTETPRRYLTPDRSERPSPERALFGEPAVEDFGEVVVTEGVLKTLAFERVGVRNAVAVLGAQNLAAPKLRYLAKFGRILVATDPDAAGDLAHARLHRALSRYSQVVRVGLSAAPDDLALTPSGREEMVAAVGAARHQVSVAA